MTRIKTIGLMGAIVDNGNMGCVALTYSVLTALEQVSQRKGISCRYIIFENTYAPAKIQRMCQELGIDKEKVSWAPCGYIHKWTSVIKYALRNLKMLRAIRSCDLVIDLTQGDSFTDIYGQERFLSCTKIKELVEKVGVPLVLGPQTYGPFQREENKQYAKKVIERATMVISRDQASADYVASFCSRSVDVTTDLAFLLPYEVCRKNDSSKIKVGINVSSLLVKNKKEPTEIRFSLKADYDEYINMLIQYLLGNSQYEVHLIPHVGEDAVKEYALKYPNTIAHDRFDTPIEAKNCIAGMDIFIGARMHATVAAFSAGVATIPTAYSRKFAGLYNNFGYSYVVDLQSFSAREAFLLTQQYMDQYEELKTCGANCMDMIREKGNLTLKLLEKVLIDEKGEV